MELRPHVRFARGWSSAINRAHLQIPLDPLLPIEQEFPRLSAYDRAYSGSYHVDLYYRPVSRWMMGHAVKAKRK